MERYFKLIDETNEIYCYEELYIQQFITNKGGKAVGGNRLLTNI